MNAAGSTSRRVVIVGGGIAGLGVAARLAHAGLPVTVLESSRLGAGASARNQGWLHSGAWYAPEHAQLARMCRQALELTIGFCPEAVDLEPPGMAFVISRKETSAAHWTQAWEQAGISYSKLDETELANGLPELDLSRVRSAYLLPDRAVRVDVLLAHLAGFAESAGAEILTETTVTEILLSGGKVRGVITGRGEEMAAAMVILAGGAAGTRLWSGLFPGGIGRQEMYTPVTLKTHLVGVRPPVGQLPLCVVDAETPAPGGFSHVPHPPMSVFGTGRWQLTTDPTDQKVVREEVDRIWEQMERFFPNLDRREADATEWAGTTVEALHMDEIEPARAPLPTVIDHADESPGVENLLTVFPGRATLWVQAAEAACEAVLKKLGHSSRPASATPPWAALRK